MALTTSLALASGQFFDSTLIFAWLDVRAAFYTVLRELLLPLGTSQTELEALVEDLEVPLLFEQPLLNMLQQPAIIPELVQDHHLTADLSEVYQKQWFMSKAQMKSLLRGLVCRLETSSRT